MKLLLLNSGTNIQIKGSNNSVFSKKTIDFQNLTTKTSQQKHKLPAITKKIFHFLFTLLINHFKNCELIHEIIKLILRQKDFIKNG